MSERFNQLQSHHASLRAQCAVQREHLGETADDIERRLAGVDRGVKVVRGLMRKPMLIVGAVALIAILGPRRLIGWASRGAVLYSTARRLRGSSRY
jgi:hypothetical protein